MLRASKKSAQIEAAQACLHAYSFSDLPPLRQGAAVGPFVSVAGQAGEVLFVFKHLHARTIAPRIDLINHACEDAFECDYCRAMMAAAGFGAEYVVHTELRLVSSFNDNPF